MIQLPDETAYFTRDTRLPPYLPFPLFLLRSGLSMTACTLYALLLHRALLSARNGWTDVEERVFVLFTEEDLGRALGRGRTAVSRALGDLEAAGLLERQAQPDHPANRLYVKLPQQPAGVCSENGTYYAPKTEHTMFRKENISKYNINNKNKKRIDRDYSYREEDSL